MRMFAYAMVETMAFFNSGLKFHITTLNLCLWHIMAYWKENEPHVDSITGG